MIFFFLNCAHTRVSEWMKLLLTRKFGVKRYRESLAGWFAAGVEKRRGEGKTCKTALSQWQHNGVLFFSRERGRLILHVSSHEVNSNTNPHSAGKGSVLETLLLMSWSCSSVGYKAIPSSNFVQQPPGCATKTKTGAGFHCSYCFMFWFCCSPLEAANNIMKVQQPYIWILLISSHAFIGKAAQKLIFCLKNEPLAKNPQLQLIFCQATNWLIE